MSVNFSEIASMVTAVLKDVVYVTDVDNCDIYYINETAAKLFEVDILDVDSWKGHKCYEIIQKRTERCEFCTNDIIKEDSYHSWEHYYAPKDMRFAIQDRLIKVNDNKLRLCVMHDITKQRKLETELREKLLQEKALNSCIEHLHTNESPKNLMFNLLGVVGEYFSADNVHIIKLDSESDRYEVLFEWYCSSEFNRLNDLFYFTLEELELWEKSFLEKGYYHFVLSNVDESEVPMVLKKFGTQSLLAVPWKNSENHFAGFIGLENPKSNISEIGFLDSLVKIISDFLLKIELHDSLHSLSLTDAMTGLRNRYSYKIKMDQLNGQRLQSLGVLYLDINGLKQLNDEYGQAYGDQTIEKVAAMLFKVFGMNAFRISGDDFIVIAPDIDEVDFKSDITELRENIKSTGISVCIGSSYSTSDIDVQKQVSLADSFMYTEKQQMFTSSQATQKYRASLAGSLASELSDNRFLVYLQPQIELDTGKLIGAEALIRKTDNEGKIIPPLSFIPFYEQQEIIHYIDLFVLETICKQFAVWEKLSPGNTIKMATNFSRITLKEPDIVKTVKEICDRYDVSPNRIVVEITESLEVFEREHLCNLILEFASEGFSVSLDDFGSGHSNLSVLTSSNFDEIKIDKSIVDNIAQNNKSLAIAKLIVNMCNDFNIEHSVAEGVEITEQYDLLRSLKCTIGQGYFFDKPLPISEFNEKYFTHSVKEQFN